MKKTYKKLRNSIIKIKDLNKLSLEIERCKRHIRINTNPVFKDKWINKLRKAEKDYEYFMVYFRTQLSNYKHFFIKEIDGFTKVHNPQIHALTPNGLWVTVDVHVMGSYAYSVRVLFQNLYYKA